MKLIGLAVLCYLIGSIPFSLLFALMLGKVDIRTKGSGNIGATNVLRSAGPAVAGLALIGDLGKGVLAAWIGMAVGGELTAAICSVAVLIGHCYSVFLKFKGGKAVATSAGLMAFLMPASFVVVAITFFVVVIISRYVSMASLIAATVFPLVTIFIFDYPLYYGLLSLFMAFLVIYKHRANIERIRNGSESKITERLK